MSDTCGAEVSGPGPNNTERLHESLGDLPPAEYELINPARVSISRPSEFDAEPTGESATPFGPDAGHSSPPFLPRHDSDVRLL